MPRRTDDAVGPVAHVLDALLVLAAIGGLLSVVWWAAAAFLGVGLVTFATGSMSPKYPTGSIAVSVPVALDQVRIGDVVTVQRGHGLPPITHRVIGIDVVPSGGPATVRLQGDANREPDPEPYRVTALRRVVLPLPPAADVLRFADSPVAVVVVGAVIVGAIAFAFWPERIRPRHRAAAAHARQVPEPVGRHVGR